MNRTMFSFIRVMVCGLFLVLAMGTAHAQFRAGVQGTVKDTGGGVVAGATVTLVNNETSKKQETTTNEDGFYTVELTLQS